MVDTNEFGVPMRMPFPDFSGHLMPRPLVAVRHAHSLDIAPKIIRRSQHTIDSLKQLDILFTAQMPGNSELLYFGEFDAFGSFRFGNFNNFMPGFQIILITIETNAVPGVQQHIFNVCLSAAPSIARARD